MPGGTLNHARFAVDYLDKGNYACVEPNAWLVTSALLGPDASGVASEGANDTQADA